MDTVDASVWVNGFDQREAGHATSRQLLAVLRTRALPIIVPNLVLAEVAGTISRTRNDPGGGLCDDFRTAPERDRGGAGCRPWSPGPGAGGPVRVAWGDAVYAAVAQQSGCTLISLDTEHLTRLGSIIMVRTPATVLADLVPPTSPSSAV
jgi:predicted nucleic acid-binding protein